MSANNVTHPRFAVVTPGHRYALANFENDGAPVQVIQFIEKRSAEPSVPSGLMVTVNNGTTNEALLEVLIDRLQYLNGKFPCRENSVALTNLEQALMWLEKRTQDRLKRGVEGQHQA